jgi:hypothetical protein
MEKEQVSALIYASFALAGILIGYIVKAVTGETRAGVKSTASQGELNNSITAQTYAKLAQEAAEDLRDMRSELEEIRERLERLEEEKRLWRRERTELKLQITQLMAENQTLKDLLAEKKDPD